MNLFNELDDTDSFDLIIKKFNLKPDFFLSKEKGKLTITETWSSSRNKSVSANRIYEFDIMNIDLIPLEIRDDVLKEVLNVYISDENYEGAALIRDFLLDV